MLPHLVLQRHDPGRSKFDRPVSFPEFLAGLPASASIPHLFSNEERSASDSDKQAARSYKKSFLAPTGPQPTAKRLCKDA